MHVCECQLFKLADYNYHPAATRCVVGRDLMRYHLSINSGADALIRTCGVHGRRCLNATIGVLFEVESVEGVEREKRKENNSSQTHDQHNTCLLSTNRHAHNIIVTASGVARTLCCTTCASIIILLQSCVEVYVYITIYANEACRNGFIFNCFFFFL